MKSYILPFACLWLLFSCDKSYKKHAELNQSIAKTSVTNTPTSQEAKNLYDFTVKDIHGNDFRFADLKGKKIMIVNTASRCGLTPQYKKLEALYKKYKDQNFVIVGFPANNFDQQEPGSNEEIQSFCQKNYGVSFPMMSKISVKGEQQAPLYAYLTQKKENGQQDAEVEWNFQKFLIGTDGKLEKVIAPQIEPDNEEIIAWIQS